MLQHPIVPDSYNLAREDASELLSSFSVHGFPLDGRDWKSAEHYYQAHRYAEGAHFDAIAAAPTPEKAKQLADRWWWRKRGNWKAQRQLMMTRAMYTKCKAHPEVAEALLATDDLKIVDTTMYDYFWGLGRDLRGDNIFGIVLMNVRDKLREEMKDA